VLFAPGVFFTILAGVLLSIVLRSPSRWISRRFAWPMRVSLVVVTVLLIAATLVGSAVLGSGLGDQLQRLFEQLPQSLATVRSNLAKISWAQSLLELGFRSTPPEVSPNKVVIGATNVLSRTFEMGVALVAIFFIGLYGAAQPEAYARMVLRLVPPHHRERARHVMTEVTRNLTRWLVGRFIAMASVALITAIGLLLARIPLPIALGIFAGLCTFVEYLGAVVSAVPAVLVALAQKPTDALWVIAIFTIAHVIEGYLLTPFITRGTVRFPPAFTLAVQLLFGAIFGVVGLTFATPVAVIAAVIVKKIYVEDYLGDQRTS
jgi:predicted PurR-regulated permease PerM